MIPAQAVEAAAELIYRTSGRKRVMSYEQARPTCEDEAQLILEAAAPHMLADILEDAANTAETDELTTAAEVIYDLRRHAKDLRPKDAR